MVNKEKLTLLIPSSFSGLFNPFHRQKPKTFAENKTVARKGGEVAKAARLQLENTTGKKVVTSQNAKSLQNTENKKIKK